MVKNDIKFLTMIDKQGALCKIETFRQMDKAADARLQTLLNHGYIIKHQKGSDMYYAGDYEITGKGSSFLHDYREERRRSLLLMLLTNLVLPIVVAFFTALITTLVTIAP